MPLFKPYTSYACPCTGTPTFASSSRNPATTSLDNPNNNDDDEEQSTFDPTSTRANYSLYPLDQLLYCADCHESRCPRCIIEEVVCWYCPSCLFEVPSSSVRSEGNRCTRSCYNCPLCRAPLAVNSIGQQQSTDEAPGEPYILSCAYCDWSSLDIGISFEKHTNITGQLQRLKNARAGSGATDRRDRHMSQAERLLLRLEGESSPLATPIEEKREQAMQGQPDDSRRDAEDTFASLGAFYRSQIAESGEGYAGTGLSDLSFSSPSSINRLLNMYSSTGKRAKRTIPKPMREALIREEGLDVFDSAADQQAIIRLQQEGLNSVTSGSQRLLQDKRYDARFADQLMPTATLLRTKRVKRCAACRQLVSRPEPKVSSTRYKFKTLALSHVPRVTLKLFHSTTATSRQPLNSHRLTPLTTYTFLLTLINPIFEPVRVTLATPAITPGPVQSKVTILCPQFDVGSNADVFEEALSGSGSGGMTDRDRRSKMQTSSSAAATDDPRAAEAGKVWDHGRNWTRVVVEVVPGVRPGGSGYMGPSPSGKGDKRRSRIESEGDESADEGEDDAVLEIPVFVRIEYEVEAGGDEGAATGGVSNGSRSVSMGTHSMRGEKEKRELAFWCVVGAGMIGS